MSESQPIDLFELTKHYTRLAALKQNLPAGNISGQDVEHFHDILSTLSRLYRRNLSEFFIPNSRMEQATYRTSYDPDDEETFTTEPRCDRHYFLMQLDAALALFIFEIEQPEKRPIGFLPLRWNQENQS